MLQIAKDELVKYWLEKIFNYFSVLNPSTETKQDNIITELKLKADLTETQPVTDAAVLSKLNDLINPEWVNNYGMDIDDSTNYYFGYNKTGSTEWRIKKMLKADLTITWSSGTSSGSTAWTNRTTQTYSEEL